jgi:DNA-binding CsgD family transcriptional regulator/tetratricopeptide (TPR) repeat protein
MARLGAAESSGGVTEDLVIVGRDEELALLEAAGRRAAVGRGSCLLVSGEPGAGKSHLMTVAAARWRAAGAVVLEGACQPYAADELAYGPFVQAWSRVGAQDGGGFATLLAELASLGELPAEVARAWLFDRVARQLDAMAERRPVVLLLDDLHWADRPTLALLRFLARPAARHKRLLVATARSDGEGRLGSAEELVDMLVSGHLDQLVLEPLSSAQTHALVVGELRGRGGDDLVDRLVQSSGGNPYLAHELAAAARQGLDGLPSTLQRVLLRRIGAHGAAAEVALATVAVAADAPVEVLDAALDAVVGPDRAATVGALVASGLLVAGPDRGRLRTRHAVLGEVALGRLVPSQRRAVHGALAVAWGEDPAAARHWEQAAEPTRALRAWLDTGRVATAAGAYGDAAHAYARALDLATRAHVPEDPGPQRLVVEAAEAMHRAGDDERAVRALRTALAAGRVTDDALRLALLDRLQSCLFAAGAAPDAFAVLEEAAGLVGGLAPSPETARIVAADGSRLMIQGRFAEGAERSAVAAQWAADLHAPDVLAYARATQGVCRAATGDLDQGLALLVEAHQLGNASGSVAIEARTAVNHCYVLANASRYPDCVQVGREALARLATRSLAHTLGAPLYYNVVVAQVALGDWDAALALCDEAEAAPVSATTVRFLALSRARVAALRGQSELADRSLEVARQDRPLGQQAFELEHAIVSVLVLRLHRRHRDALALARETVDSCPGGIDRLRLCAEALGALADLQAAGGRVRQVGDPRAVRDELLTAANADLDGWGGHSPEAINLRLLCAAEAERLDGPSVQHWQEIADDWARLGLRYDAAHASLRLAEALVATRAGPEAAAALLGAHQTAVRLGAWPLLARIDAVARRGRLPLPAPAAPSAGTTAPVPHADPRLDTLTRRETEVLELVRLGLTNRQISRRLLISEKTAAVHVSNLLAKLGVGNRVEAAQVGRPDLGTSP